MPVCPITEFHSLKLHKNISVVRPRDINQYLANPQTAPNNPDPVPVHIEYEGQGSSCTIGRVYKDLLVEYQKHLHILEPDCNVTFCNSGIP